MALSDKLTILRIILSPIFFLLYMSEPIVLKQVSVIVFFIAAITDWYDGWIARKYGYFSRWGKFLDPLADKILTSFAFIAFLYSDFIGLWMVVVIIFRDISITVLRGVAEYKGKPVVTSFSAKTKTVVQYIVIYYLLVVSLLQTFSFFQTKLKIEIESLLSKDVIFGMMLVVTLATIYTGIVYVYENRKIILEIFSDNFEQNKK